MNVEQQIIELKPEKKKTLNEETLHNVLKEINNKLDVLEEQFIDLKNDVQKLQGEKDV